MRDRIQLWMFVACNVVLMAACSPKLTQYKPNPPVANPPQRKLKIAVAPFEVLASSTALWHTYEGGNVGAALVVPFYTVSADRYYPDVCALTQESIAPENAFTASLYGYGKPAATSSNWGSDSAGTEPRSREALDGSYAACLAQELRASGLFSAVDYKNWAELAGSASDYDLIVTGRFYYDHRSGTAFSLSLFLMILQEMHLVPMGASHREIAFEVQVLDPKAPGDPLWKKSVWIKDDKAGGIEFFPKAGMDTTNYQKDTPEVLAEAFLGLRDELATALSPGGELDNWVARRDGR